MSTPIVTVDGFPLGAHGFQGWNYTVGPSPNVQGIACDRLVGEQVMAQARPNGSTLNYTIAGGTSTISCLTALKLGPAAHPDQAVLYVSDVRWQWPGRHVRGDFNVRRRTGERRRTSQNLPIAVQPIADDVAFAPWTLKNGQRWNAGDMLRRVLEQLCDGEERFEVRWLPPNTLTVEDLHLDDPGPGGLRRALAYFGGRADVFVDADGTVVIFDRTDKSDEALVGLSGGVRTQVRGARFSGPPSVVGPPLWAFQDRSHERAARVRVLVTRLVELRFDMTEGGTDNVEQERNDLPLDGENVLPVPDLELDVPALNGRAARTVIQGTWITIDEALAAWNAAGWPLGRQLALKQVRKYFIGGGLENLYAPPVLDEEGIYARRLATLRTHYRQVYRLARRWRDRLGELLPRRAELRDAETGTSAPAEVYADYATQLTRRGQEKAVSANPKNCSVFTNRYAAGEGVSVVATAITSMKPAPATVTIVDQDQGVLRLNYVLEPRIGERSIFFTAIKTSTIPSILPNASSFFSADASLAESHEASVVISTVAVAPNDRRAFHLEEVTPSEVEAAKGFKIGTCSGPIVTIRVNPANLRAVARFVWDDAKSDQIRLAFGFDGQGVAMGDPGKAFGDPANPAELRALALDAAARYYAARRDHVVGSLTTGWSPGIRPTGAAGPVVHGVAPDGTPTTTVSFLDDIPAPDVFSTLPEWVRKVVTGEAQP